MASTAMDALIQLFSQYGLADLANDVGALAGNTDMTDAQKYSQVYTLPAYQKRFPGMAEMSKRGQIITEGDYISQEKAYKDVLTSAGLPAGFHDSPQDMADWMLNAVSPNELQSRISRSQRIVDSADPSLINAAQSYYGLDKDHLLAHVLDPTAAAPLIDKQLRSVEAGAAASRNQIELDKAHAESLAVDPYAAGLFNNPYNPNAINDAFGKASTMSKTDTRLSAIEGTVYNKQDAVDANLRNDNAKQLESQKRTEREAARFSGSAGTSSGTLRTSSGL